MAKVVAGPFIRGTIDGLSFYYSSTDGRLCRMQAGITSTQFHKGAQFGRVRKESKELSLHSSDARFFRKLLKPFLQFIPAHYGSRQINLVLNRIKKLHYSKGVSYWIEGLKTSEGRQELSKLNLGRAKLIGDIVRCDIHCGMEKVVFSDLGNLQKIALPQQATHVLLTAVRFMPGGTLRESAFDFSESVLYSPWYLSKELELKFTTSKEGGIYFLSAVFFAEMRDGEYVLLKERCWNGFGGIQQQTPCGDAAY